VSYKQDAAVLLDFAVSFTESTPLILLRHARALPRSEWKRADLERPLDKVGTADAATLAGLLACFAPQATVVSSATVRCLDTVRPYAALTGSSVRPSDALVARYETSPTTRAARLFSLIAARSPGVVCAHRENLPALLQAAVEFLGGYPGGPAVPDKVAKPLSKGAFLVLHTAAGALLGIDRYDWTEG
jgi:phosphohistidine phosphatase SixA